jgi:hypothetical protein
VAEEECEIDLGTNKKGVDMKVAAILNVGTISIR